MAPGRKYYALKIPRYRSYLSGGLYLQLCNLFLEASKTKYCFVDFSISHIERTGTQTNICSDRERHSSILTTTFSAVIVSQVFAN